MPLIVPGSRFALNRHQRPRCSDARNVLLSPEVPRDTFSWKAAHGATVTGSAHQTEVARASVTNASDDAAQDAAVYASAGHVMQGAACQLVAPGRQIARLARVSFACLLQQRAL